MARLKKVVALMACALVACFVIAGCGKQDFTQDFIGTWEICEMEEGGEVTSQDDLDLLRKFNLNVTLELTEDKAVLDLFGETQEGTWEATASKTGTITFEDSSADMAINDEGVLELSSESSVLRFKQVEATDDAAEATDDADDAEAVEDADAAEEAKEDEAA